jgi:hypothetical protein
VSIFNFECLTMQFMWRHYSCLESGFVKRLDVHQNPSVYTLENFEVMRLRPTTSNRKISQSSRRRCAGSVTAVNLNSIEQIQNLFFVFCAWDDIQFILFEMLLHGRCEDPPLILKQAVL